MSRLENRQLLSEFYDEIKSDYPDITEEQVIEICSFPWKFLKAQMRTGELETVRFKYLGTFQVYVGRAKIELESLKERFKEHKIQPKRFFMLKDMLENFLVRQN